MPVSKAAENRNWIPYAGLALTLAGMIYQGGVLSNRVTQNELRIAEMKAVQTSIWQKVNDMNIRGEKNATKLDFLVDEAMSNNSKKYHDVR